MRRFMLLLLVLMLLLLAGSLALATNGESTLPWFTVDGGGGRSEGGDLALSGTIGQTEARLAATGGQFRLQGGFWSGPAGADGVIYSDLVYLPLIQRP